MTTYTAQLTITARTAYTTWYEASAIACTVTATAWHWYTEAFFSPAAKARYEWAGQMLGCAIALVYLYAKRWADSEVEGALPAAEALPAPESEADPFSPEVNPLPVAMVEAPAKQPTIRELKAQAKGKVPNYGRMTKPQLLEALRTA